MRLTKAERLLQQMRKKAEAAAPKPKTPPPTASRPTITLAPVPIIEWHHCYDDSWRDLITPESFSHPAKAGRRLLHNIFSHLESIGALTPGRSIVVDPFGGIGTTAIIGAWRGYPVVCCELEEKFVNLMKDNFAKERPKWEDLNRPIPRVVQGDSRKLRQHIQAEIDAIVSSPPYTSDIKVLDFTGKKSASEQSYNSKHFGPDDVGYGKSEKNLGNLEAGGVDAVVSSPPYAETPVSGNALTGGDQVNRERLKESLERKARGERGIGLSDNHNLRYGQTDGQLGTMEPGGVEAIISSPPYSELNANIKGHGIEGAGVSKDPKYGQAEYGDSPGQLGQMKESEGVDAIVSSPPYAEINTGAGGLNTKPPQHEGQQGGRSADAPSQETDQKYGETQGQMARMEKGDVDVVISAPPYSDIEVLRGDKGPTDGSFSAKHFKDGGVGYGKSQGQLGAMDAGGVDAVVSSPPYSETILNDDQRQAGKGEKLRWGTNEEYGTSPGQLGTMKEQTGVDAVISSPPYADGGVHGNSNDIDHDEQARATRAMGYPLGTSSVTGYGTSEGQLSAKEPGAVDAVVSSPPFGTGDSASAHSITERNDKSAEWIKSNCGSAATQGYGTSPGQMAQMETKDIDAVVSSPPFQGSHDGLATDDEPRQRMADGRLPKTGMLNQVNYGNSQGQIGTMEQETFWTAARDIVRECHAILRPGGYAVWIVKAFVRDKAIVDFPNDWRKLCEYCGFTTELEVHAMLVREKREKALPFEEGPKELVDRKERKSFFRRLAESKGSPRIDYEVVLFTRKK